jgi:hypothetical protein
MKPHVPVNRHPCVRGSECGVDDDSRRRGMLGSARKNAAIFHAHTYVARRHWPCRAQSANMKLL